MAISKILSTENSFIKYANKLLLKTICNITLILLYNIKWLKHDIQEFEDEFVVEIQKIFKKNNKVNINEIEKKIYKNNLIFKDVS